MRSTAPSLTTLNVGSTAAGNQFSRAADILFIISLALAVGRDDQAAEASYEVARGTPNWTICMCVYPNGKLSIMRAESLYVRCECSRALPLSNCVATAEPLAGCSQREPVCYPDARDGVQQLRSTSRRQAVCRPCRAAGHRCQTDLKVNHD